MHKIAILVKNDLLSLFHINYLLQKNNKQEKIKNTFTLTIILFILVIGIIGIYKLCDLMAINYAPLGLINLLPAQMMGFCSILVFITTIYKVEGTLFHTKDYDTIMSLPIKTTTFITSKVIELYLFNFIIPFIIMFITGLVYTKYGITNFQFYVYYYLTIFIIPMVPIVLAAIIGSIITVIVSHFRLRNVMTIIISLFSLLAFFTIGSIITNQTDNMEMANIGLKMMKILNAIYPLTLTYTKIIVERNTLYFILFMILPLALFISFIFALSKVYKKVNTRLESYNGHIEFEWKEQMKQSPFNALYKKELKKFLSSSPYILNTLMPLILFTIILLSFIVFGDQKIEWLLDTENLLVYLASLAPIILSFFVSLCSTTSSSLSLEGKNIWILKSSPIQYSTILLSKIIVNIVVLLPMIIIDTVIMLFYLKLNAVGFLLTLSMPIAYSFLTANIGMISNLYYPNLNWNREIEVIRNSKANLITTAIGLLSILLPLVLIFKTNFHPTYIMIATTILMAALATLLYQYIKKIAEQELKKW